MKSNEVQITFSNQTFKLTLNEGKSIDLRLKNDNGNIYMGKANATEGSTNNRKFNGYSSVGLEPNSKEKIEKVEDVEEYQNESSTSSIHELLNKNVERKESSDVKEEPTSKQSNEKKADDNSSTNHDTNIVPDENTLSQEIENDDNDLDDKFEEDNNTDREEYTNTNKENSTNQEEKSGSSQEKKSSLVNRYFPLDEDEDEE